MLCKYWITSTYSNWSDWGCQLSDGMLLGVLVRLSLPAEHVWRLLLNQHCLFLHLWGNWPCTTRIAYPLLPVWSPRICRVRFHLNFKFTPLFFALFKDLNLVGIGRIGLDFVGIRRIRFHFIWIWGWFWYASSWGCPISLFGSRLLHSDVICHPGCLWLYISTLIFNTLILIFLWINHLSRVSSPVSWSIMSTQSFGGAGSVFPWGQQTQVRI